ncbi:MAG: T9SS type A sorting domain-containing protein, partial [Bacteroidales bacterium]
LINMQKPTIVQKAGLSNNQHTGSLKPGFRAGDGVEFSAKLAPHGNCYQGKNFKILGIEQCYENKMMDLSLNNINNNEAESIASHNKGFSKDINNNDNNYNSKISCNIYPNPAIETINLKINNYQGDLYKIIISDMTGKQVLSKQMKKNFTSISVSELKQGLYMMEINSDSFNFYKKFIVK